MNVFVLDLDPKLAALYHNDRHTIKMILESAQLLSTACRLSGLAVGYKVTHKNHPCSKWVRESIENWRWLKELARHLNEQYKLRYNHVEDHKSWQMIASLPEPNLPSNSLTPFALAMPTAYHSQDAVASYRSYYVQDKRHLASWKYPASKPSWYR